MSPVSRSVSPQSAVTVGSAWFRNVCRALQRAPRPHGQARPLPLRQPRTPVDMQVPFCTLHAVGAKRCVAVRVRGPSHIAVRLGAVHASVRSYSRVGRQKTCFYLLY